MTNLTIAGSGNSWSVCDATNGLVKSEHSSREEALAALGYKLPTPAPEPRGCYRITRSIDSAGGAVWTADYITHNGEVRYMMHSAIIDPVRKLVDRMTGRVGPMYRV